MGDVIDLKTGLSAEVIPLFTGENRPSSTTPPKRDPQLAYLSGGVGEAWRRATAKPEDAAAQRRIREAARAARKEMDRPVHPSLLMALAAKMEALAFMATQLESEARSLGLRCDAETFNNIASIVETRAAIVEASAQ